MPKDVAGVEVARQLLKSGTLVGANGEESDGAELAECLELIKILSSIINNLGKSE